MTEYWLDGGGNPLVEMPTGSGKSLTMASLVRDMHLVYEARVLLMTHVRELVEQDARAISNFWPNAPVGIYSAGLGKRDADAPVLVAGVQSIFKNPEVVGRRDVIVIDEAHLLSRKEDGQYQRVLKKLRELQPNLRMVGFTATPYRTDSGLLTEGWKDKPALFDDIVYRADLLDLIRRKILCPIVPYVSPERIDLSGVRTTAGDYNKKDLEGAVDKADINERVANELCVAGQDRGLWIVFGAGVDHAIHLRDLLRARGITTEAVLGDTPDAERTRIIADARQGNLRCLCGNNVLTTGLDLPNIDLIGMVRPTKSKGLFVQMIGRGLRMAPGKQNCIILDFTDNTRVFGPVDMIDGSKTAGKGGTPPIKECLECHAINHISAKACTQCGCEFPIVAEVKYQAKSTGAAVTSDQSEPVWMDVEGVIYRRHQKDQVPDSLRIDYNSGLSTFSHWVSLEHPQAGGFARRWWSNNSFSGVAPANVDAALANIEDLRVPGRIQVVQQGKFWRIVHWDYSVPAGRVIPTMRDIGVSGKPKWWRRSA